MTPEQMTEYIENVRKQCVIEIDAMNASGYGRDGEPPEDLHLSDIVEKWIVRPLCDRIRNLEAKANEEHKLRCDLERRFDRSIASNSPVRETARKLCNARASDNFMERHLRETLRDMLIVAGRQDSLIAEKDDKIDAWKSATGLIDSGGDPSGIEPEDLEREVFKLRGLAGVDR